MTLHSGSHWDVQSALIPAAMVGPVTSVSTVRSKPSVGEGFVAHSSVDRHHYLMAECCKIFYLIPQGTNIYNSGSRKKQRKNHN